MQKPERTTALRTEERWNSSESTSDAQLSRVGISGLLDRAAERYGERLFLAGPVEMSYGEAASRTRCAAAWLRKAGVGRGDRVVVVTKNRVEAVLMAFAAARIGAIFVFLNNEIKPYGFRRVVEQCEPKVVVLDDTTVRLADESPESLKVWATDLQPPRDGVPFVAVLEEPEPTELDFPGIDLDPACLLYTSGSTGSPRGVVVSHDNILFTTRAIQDRLNYKPDDLVGVFLPLSFDVGLYQIFLAMEVGASIYLGQRESVGPELISKLASERISVLPGVPTLFAGLLKLLERQPIALPDLRCVTNTGARLPNSHVERLLKLLPDLEVFLMYGLTECKRVSILRPDESDLKPGSVGRPLAGTEAYVVGEDGERVLPGEAGELVIRGRHVTGGYWKAPEETAARFRQGGDVLGNASVLYTGDLCRIDDEGFLYFVERKDNLVKVKGFRVSPVEVEEAACDVSGVYEACAVKQADGLRLFVSFGDQNATESQVRQGLLERLEDFKVPSLISSLPNLPHTANGKIDRKELQNLASKALTS